MFELELAASNGPVCAGSKSNYQNILASREMRPYAFASAHKCTPWTKQSIATRVPTVFSTVLFIRLASITSNCSPAA